MSKGLKILNPDKLKKFIKKKMIIPIGINDKKIIK